MYWCGQIVIAKTLLLSILFSALTADTGLIMISQLWNLTRPNQAVFSIALAFIFHTGACHVRNKPPWGGWRRVKLFTGRISNGGLTRQMTGL